MIPVVSIVGKSNSGKTTLIEKLIPLFKSNGYRIGIIKHDAHQFEIDYEGKDSRRITKSGADTTVISSREKIAMIKTPVMENSIDQLVDSLLQDVDIVITEGYKREGKPKIEVVRNGLPITSPENNLIAVVLNAAQNEQIIMPEGYAGVETYKFYEYDKIYGLIETRFLKGGPDR